MKFQVGSGIDQYIGQLENLAFKSEEMVGQAIYEGASIVADAIRQNLNTIPVDDGYANEGEKLNGIKTIQKTGLINGFGIAKMKNENGYYHVKAGFHGYNGLKTKRFPSGQPNVMIARTVEAGNSFTKKMPFVAPAVRATKDEAERKMAEVIDDEIEKIMT